MYGSRGMSSGSTRSFCLGELFVVVVVVLVDLGGLVKSLAMEFIADGLFFTLTGALDMVFACAAVGPP